MRRCGRLSGLLPNRADLGSRRSPESGSCIPPNSRIAERRQAQVLTRSCSRVLREQNSPDTRTEIFVVGIKSGKMPGTATPQMSEQ